MKIDTHIHADFSSDSLIKIEDLIQKAIKNNYLYICFTEHFDLLPDELINYGLLPLKKYYNRILQMREKYPTIKIGFGLEIGEPHRTEELKQKLLMKIEPDYTIGSLHLLKMGLNMSTPINFSLQEDIIMLYYKEIIEMINNGGFDTLGHLGIFKREVSFETISSLAKYYDVLDSIFHRMIEKNICLEINNSGYRAPLNSFIPESHELERYKALGGELITIGSDSHRIESFDKYYTITVKELKRLKFKTIYFKENDQWNPIVI